MQKAYELDVIHEEAFQALCADRGRWTREEAAPSLTGSAAKGLLRVDGQFIQSHFDFNSYRKSEEVNHRLSTKSNCGARIERDVIVRGIFTSASDLARKLRRYINAYSANARPFQWKYSDLSRRIRSNDLMATGH